MTKELEAFERVWEDCSKLDLDYVSKHNLMDDLRGIKKALEERDMYFKALCDIESGENVRKVLERTLT